MNGVPLWSATAPLSSMAEDSRDKSERKLRIDQMPIAVKRLADLMLGIDANFDIEDWLIQKANEDIALIQSDLEREKIQVEQRLHRLEAIAKRLNPEDMREVPQGQTNLFDCFDIPLPLKHLTNRIEEIFSGYFVIIIGIDWIRERECVHYIP